MDAAVEDFKYMHDIGSLLQLASSVNKYCESTNENKPVVKFRGTVKLHGTSGAVRVTRGEVTAAGRSQILTVSQDNYGFAHFVSGRTELFSTLAQKFISDDVTFYGEWCGQGIQKRVAVSQLPKMFVIFGIFDHNANEWYGIHSPELKYVDVKSLNDNNVWLITQTKTFDVTIDFNDPQPAAERIYDYTVAVEEVCPFGELLGVKAMGEGIVWTSYDFPKRMVFKSKGEKHKKHGEKRQVQVDPEKLASINALVELLLPEWRLEQGLTYLKDNNFPFDKTSTGEYLKWISCDILKEETVRISANPYPWKDIVRAVSKTARQYFNNYLERNVGLS